MIHDRSSVGSSWYHMMVAMTRPPEHQGATEQRHGEPLDPRILPYRGASLWASLGVLQGRVRVTGVITVLLSLHHCGHYKLSTQGHTTKLSALCSLYLWK